MVLAVLGMPGGQVELYVLNSQRVPSEDYDTKRSLDCLKAVTKGSTEIEDTEALALVSEDLRELWLWKRRKGDYFGGDGKEMYEVSMRGSAGSCSVVSRGCGSRSPGDCVLPAAGFMVMRISNLPFACLIRWL